MGMAKMPSLPSFDGNDSKGGMETICADCGKTISANEPCDNPSCSRISRRKITRPKNRPDDPGKNPRLKNVSQQPTVFNGQPMARMVVPGAIPISAQTNNATKKPANKPINNIMISDNNNSEINIMLSDDDAEVVDPRHLDNCKHSADHLGL